jgi:carbon monoxide dehydrogenase subunit G
MLKLESRSFAVKGSQKDVFEFVSDFRKLEKILPEDLMKQIEASETECSFDFPGLGRIGLRVSEKVPFSQVTITGTEDAPTRFTLHINLSPVSKDQTRLHFSLQAGLNMLLEMMARKPLQDFLDMLANKMEAKDFRK